MSVTSSLASADAISHKPIEDKTKDLPKVLFKIRGVYFEDFFLLFHIFEGIFSVNLGALQSLSHLNLATAAPS